MNLTRQKFRYEEIASHFSSAIEEGTIPYGTKLPSLRQICQRYNCALSVALQAYQVLEAQGIVYSREKSGYFASAAKKSPLPRPHKEHFSLQSEEIKPLSIIGRIVEASNDKKIIPLGAGLPSESLLPVKGIKQSLAQVFKDETHLLAEYSDESGCTPLRQEIASLMLDRGVSVPAGEVLITNGCAEAISLAIQSCSSAGDVIAVESPAFLGIIQVLDQLKRRIIPIPTSVEKGMDLDHLESVLQKGEIKAIIMTAIHQNPLGYVMDEADKIRALALAEEYEITLIEDDIYNQCSFSHQEERPIKSYDKSGRVIYCSSFSKTISPGLRVGWMVPGKKLRACRNLKLALTLGGSPPVQKSMADFLQSSRYKKHILFLQKTIARQAAELKQLLIENLPAGSGITDPRGGFYFWVELPVETDTLLLFERALENNISIVPGQAFSTGGRFKNCMRISYASPITEESRNAVILLGKLIKNLSLAAIT